MWTRACWSARRVDGSTSNATEPVAYLLNDPGWNVVWQQRFWNHRINEVVTLAPSAVPGPMSQKRVTVPASGRLPIRDRSIVASGTDTFVGTPVAHQSLGLDSYGLTLWRLDRPAALSTITQNVKPNGDMFGHRRRDRLRLPGRRG